jgi:(1->4)-alpha-D-glucan 1-alpha-D-glucosylmutase
VLDALTVRLRDPADELALRFQQFTGAVMAKGVEDTAYYRWTRFAALNEVGGDPSRFGVPPEEFHAAASARQERWPDGMTTLSTHDTKLGEDVRARLAVLSEMVDDWSAALDRWTDTVALPDPSLGHLLWQTAVGAWPIGADRLHGYLEKAAREAAAHTSWADPDCGFEAALHAAIDQLYDGSALGADVAAFATAIRGYGWSNALGPKLVQLAGPGVPDVYQGTELWENSLVDPDNRRAVDFAFRQELLDRLDGGWLPPVDETGAAKLLVVSRALRLRRDRPELFTGYRPVRATGPAADHVLAFDRGGAVAVATRLPLTLARGGGWRDTVLELPESVAPPHDTWHDALTGVVYRGPRVALKNLLAAYPVALLVGR